MADLKQALIWLAEGKKIQNREFLDKRTQYLEMWAGKIVDDDLCEAQQHLDADSCWELYVEPKPVAKIKSDHLCKRLVIDQRLWKSFSINAENTRFCVSNENDQPIMYQDFCIFCGLNKPIPPPQYDPREVQLNDPLEDDANYIVWDAKGHRHFAYWDSEDKSFYSLVNLHSFALDVKNWIRLPERQE